jgi:hypothetical protein
MSTGQSYRKADEATGRDSTYALRLVTSEANLTPIFDFAGYFDVNKMFINTTWKLFNVNNTRRICVTSVRVESIKTVRTNYEF